MSAVHPTEPRTVAELIEVLRQLPGEAPVRAYGPSSMSTSPIWLHITAEGAVELLGDE